MTQSESSFKPNLKHIPCPDPQVLNSIWTTSICARALLWLLLSLTSLVLGWQLNTSGHSRLPSAIQTSPALPELRAETSPQPSLLGAGEVAQSPSRVPLPRWTELAPVATGQGFVNELNLITLGRMNLDGG
jgi:hypothetical protein